MSLLRIQRAGAQRVLGLFLTAALSFTVACEDTEGSTSGGSTADAGPDASGDGNEAGKAGSSPSAGKGGAGGQGGKGAAGKGSAGNGAAGKGGAGAGGGGAAGSDDSDAGVTDEDAGEAEAPQAFKITFSTTECFGFCPVYTVSLDQAGQVKWNGERNVDEEGAAEKTVSAAAAAEVFDALADAGYFELNDKYATEEDGCARVRTDSPTHNWSVERDGETKALSHYLGCEGVAALDKLEDVRVLLVRKAEIQLWIGAVN
jgi:hypothetical protein